MALYLVDRTFEGEPIGIWNDAYENYYVPGNENAQARAQSTLDSRKGTMPWSVLAEHLADSMNHRSWWEALESPLELEAALARCRDDHFADQSAQTLTDK